MQSSLSWEVLLIGDRSELSEFSLSKSVSVTSYTNLPSAVYAAQGEWILLMSAGDVFTPDAFSCLKETDLTDVQIAAFDGLDFDHRDRHTTRRGYLRGDLLDQSGSFCPLQLEQESGFVVSDLFVPLRMYQAEYARKMVAFLPEKTERPYEGLLFSLLSVARADCMTIVDRVLYHHRSAPYERILAQEVYIRELEQMAELLKAQHLWQQSENAFANLVVQRFRQVWTDASGYTEKQDIVQRYQESFLCQEIDLSGDDTCYTHPWGVKQMRGLLSARDWYENYEQKRSPRAVRRLLDWRAQFQPRISVVIPVYNMERFIGACIRSVQEQTLREIEIICVNDGSTDSSLQCMQELLDKEPRAILLDQENGGMSSARNSGAAAAHGTYLYFLDSDDYIDPDTLQRLYENMEERQLEILFFEGCTEYEQGAEEACRSMIRSDYYTRYYPYPDVYQGLSYLAEAWLNGEYRVSPVMQMVRRDFYIRHKLNFYNGILYEDNLHTMESLLYAERVGFLAEAFYHRRVFSASSTMQAVRFDHPFGYFMVYKNMQQLIAQHEDVLNPPDRRILEQIAEQNLKNGIAKYTQTQPQERFRYYGLPRELFDEFFHLVAIPGDLQINEKTLRRTLENAEKDKVRLKASLDKVQNEAAQSGREKERIEAQLQKQKQELQDIRNSTSYQIGKGISLPVRKMRQALKKSE